MKKYFIHLHHYYLKKKSMNKLLQLTFFISCFCIGQAFSQDVQNKNVQVKFFRPSLTSAFIDVGSSQASSVYSSFESVPMEGRFDGRFVKSNVISVNLPPRPEMPNTEKIGEIKKVMAEHQKAVEEWNKIKDAEIRKKLTASISRDVVANFFGRDEAGNLSYDNIMKSAEYSASDNQALSAAASANEANVYTEIAEELMKRGFIAVYEINSIETYDQYYDRKEEAARAAAAITKKEPTPVKRTLEGWRTDFSFFIYRLNWSDSISSIFYSTAWVDKNTNSANRNALVSAFNSFNFPVDLVFSGSSSASSSQPLDPEYYELLKIKRKSMQELLSELGTPMQDEMVFQGGRNIDDFKMRAPVFQESPIKVKLGTKEGLYYDERFFAYDIESDKDGNLKKTRKGVLRASIIADNAMIAKGESPASTFSQQGGKKLLQGNLVELYEDYGLGLNLGYTPDSVVGGIYIGAEARVSSFLKSKESWGKYLRGLHVNVSVNLKSVKKGEVFEDLDEIGGSLMTYGFSLSRETYFTKRGNVYLMPELGGGLIAATLNKVTDDEGSITGTALMFNFGAGFGMHLSPTTSLFARYCINIRPAGADEWTDDNGKAYTIPPFSDKTIFGRIEGTSMPLTFGIRNRF